MPLWWFSESRSQIKRARGLVYRNLETVTPNTVLLSLAFVCSTVGYHTTHCQRFCFLPRTTGRLKQMEFGGFEKKITTPVRSF
jgi:hypothetical protein